MLGFVAAKNLTEDSVMGPTRHGSLIRQRLRAFLLKATGAATNASAEVAASLATGTTGKVAADIAAAATGKTTLAAAA